MSLTVALTDLFPYYSTPIENPAPNARWKITHLNQISQGEVLKDEEGEPLDFVYIEEIATGNLYRYSLIEKFFAVAVCTLFYGHLYCVLTMAANLICIPIDIIGIATEALLKLGEEWKKGQEKEAVRRFFGRLTEIPSAVLKDIWAIGRAPFYTLAMMVAAAYGLYNPLGAVIWYNKIETHWHDGKDYTFDFRHHFETDFAVKPWQSYREGKISFMIYCCMQCGNSKDSRFIPAGSLLLI